MPRKLATGASQLSSGTEELADGTAQSATGARELSDGLAKLSDGGEKLADGTEKLADGLAKGADQVPTYDESTRTKLAEVVATPVTVRATDIALRGHRQHHLPGGHRAVARRTGQLRRAPGRTVRRA